MSVNEVVSTTKSNIRERGDKPPLSGTGIVLMNFGFFGIQFSFGLQQTAINPLFTLIGAHPDQLPLLNLAGPMTGLLIQPLIGAISDRTWSPRWGRRKPFFLVGAAGCSVVLFAFPFVSALWMAFLFMWLLDISNNTAMEPYRAFISDRLPANQLARGFLTQSLFIGAGAVTANLLLFVFQKIVSGGTTAGVPYWVFAAFWVGTVASIGSVLVSVISTKEIPPTEDELAELRAKPKGFVPAIREIKDAVWDAGRHAQDRPGLHVPVVRDGGLLAVRRGEHQRVGLPRQTWHEGILEAAGWVGLVNGSYNLVTIFAALALMPLARKFGAKWVGAAALALAGVGLFWFPHITNQYVLFVPMIGLGIAWASMTGIPYIMVSSMVPKERSGVYMGIVNMMIVVPMLIETFTFGWIFENLLDNKGTNAITLVAALMACAAIAMLWIKPPSEGEESALMPLGSPREITVYDQVIVGSDGSPSSLYAVDRAHAVAAEADAQVVVVTAYNPSTETRPEEAVRQDMHGKKVAQDAMRATVEYLTSDRVRRIEQRVVAADPAAALLAAAEGNPANLIVVGNRGLGAAEGEMLGVIAAKVVREAVCDVLIVQGTRATPAMRRRGILPRVT